MSTTALLLLSVVSLNATPRGILYDFSATWCGPCQQMSPIVARLEREGLPIQKIDVDQQPEMAQKYGVRPIPAFVLVIDGKVADRTVGVTSEANLRQMLAKIPPAESAPEQQREVRVKEFAAVAEGKPAKPSAKLFQLPSLPPLFRKKREVSIDDPLAAANEPAVIRANIDAKEKARAPAAARPAGPLTTSTRVRVKDRDGINFGSGTVIDSRTGRTVILTCGHIFRELKEGSTIEVDLFDGERAEPYVGKLIDFDTEADVGLIAIPTASEISTAKIAAVGAGAHKGDAVTCIGCGGGDPPTEQKQKVTALNRYLGPSNIECTGVPIQGRSGGGLFNAAGDVIGVCIAADQKEQRGIYAGLQCVHDLLRKAGMEHLVEGVPESSGELADRSPETPAADRADLVAVSEAATHRRRGSADTNADPNSASTDADLAGLQARRAEESGEEEGSTAGNPADKEGRTGDVGEAEVICIIRPLGKPNAASRVVVINRASSKFVGYLTGEIRRQPQPTMRSISFDPRDGAEKPLDRRRNSAANPSVAAPVDTVQPRVANRVDSKNESREQFRRTEDADQTAVAAANGVAGNAAEPLSRTPHRYRRSAESR